LGIDGQLQVSPQLVNKDDKGNILLNYLTVSTKSKTKTRYNRKVGFHISKWTGREDSAGWLINIDKPGTFKLKIDYAAEKELEGRPFEIKTGTNSLQGMVIATGGLFESHEFP
jgi:alpha-L-fucosidase